MDINQRIAKIPFIILYGIAAFFYMLSSVSVYLHQRDLSLIETDQPWDYFLASKLSALFGVSTREGILLSIPVMLLLIYAVIKVVGWLVNLDKKSEINGDNHAAIIVIMMLLPNFIFQLFLFGFGIVLVRGWGLRYAGMTGFALVVIFSIVTWIGENKAKKRKK